MERQELYKIFKSEKNIDKYVCDYKMRGTFDEYSKEFLLNAYMAHKLKE